MGANFGKHIRNLIQMPTAARKDHKGSRSATCPHAACLVTLGYPLTITPFDEMSNVENINIVLEAEDVNVYAGYRGHSVLIHGYEPDPSAGPYR
jgi:hypothetical protein